MTYDHAVHIMGALKAIKAGSLNGVGMDWHHFDVDTMKKPLDLKNARISSSRDINPIEKIPGRQTALKKLPNSITAPSHKSKLKSKICKTTFMSDGTVSELGRRHRASQDYSELQRTGKISLSNESDLKSSWHIRRNSIEVVEDEKVANILNEKDDIKLQLETGMIGSESSLLWEKSTPSHSDSSGSINESPVYSNLEDVSLELSSAPVAGTSDEEEVIFMQKLKAKNVKGVPTTDGKEAAVSVDCTEINDQKSSLKSLQCFEGKPNESVHFSYSKYDSDLANWDEDINMLLTELNAALLSFRYSEFGASKTNETTRSTNEVKYTMKVGK